MNIRLLKKWAALAVLLISFFSNAQKNLGISQSNYAGIMGADIQPASIVDSRFKFDLNLIGVDVSLWQNSRYLKYDNIPGRGIRYLLDPNPNYSAWKKPDSTYIENNWADIGDNKFGNKTKAFHSSLQIDLLNFMFHINPKIAVGFAPKIRAVNSMDKMNSSFRKLLERDFDYTLNQDVLLESDGLNQSSMLWNEFGVNYAQVINDEGAHFFKAGVRLKLLQGVGATYLHANQFSINVDTQDTAAVLKGDFEYGVAGNIGALTDGGLQNVGFNMIPDLLKLGNNNGFGADLGFVYEWRPKYKEHQYEMDGVKDLWRRDVNKYKLRLGVSVLDIGGINYTKNAGSRNFAVDATNFNLAVFDSISSFADYTSRMDSLINSGGEWTTTEDTIQEFFMNTPTALSIQADWNIYKRFYLNATGYFNLIGKNNKNAVKARNQFSLTPSYDFSFIQLALPLSYNNYSGFKAGLGARLGPLTIGVTDIRTIKLFGEFRGAEAYASLRVPILYEAPKDRDNDKVSDAVDGCIETPGLWKFRGCPDTDGDGIQDSEDSCPEIAGLEKFNGCPDTDGDGIQDAQDNCPKVAGLKEFDGCPDTDGDKIMDREDDCPDVAGLAAFKGCPDTDGDGIKDLDDACPNVKGPKVLNGCPDTDNDGLLDYIDNCPTEFGPKENNGCPWPDTDGDGLLDKDDKCPKLAGPIRNEGCPYQDTDEDGIPDVEDKCPATPGVIENEGCPEIEKEVQEIINTAFENLEFETGRSKIKERSFESLTELANLLIEKDTWKLQIAGHTDNVGSAQGNLILSKKRSEAVKQFMIEKGVNEERLNALYFGETDPIADNNTKEGRQKNRRVEMTIMFD